MYTTLQQARDMCRILSKRHNASYVIVGERGDYDVMSYSFWVGSTYPDYVEMWHDGKRCEDEE